MSYKDYNDSKNIINFFFFIKFSFFKSLNYIRNIAVSIK